MCFIMQSNACWTGSAKRAVIENEWDGDVQVTAVAGELQQVFSDLLANSLDAIDKEGIIKLRVLSNRLQ